VEQADGSFKVRIDAWVFEEESRRLATSAFASWMGIDLDKLSPEQKATFAERTRYFHTDSERGKELKVRLAGQIFTLPRTDASGRAQGEFSVGKEWVQWKGDWGMVSWTLEVPGYSKHGQLGFAFVIPAEGVFIVSDIDDTIKISEVRDKKALMRNTFVEPFRAVPGMAEWYREMQRIGTGEPRVFFHYLSASPIQLGPALAKFLRDADFPESILYLRESTSWRTLYANQKDSIAHKKKVLTRLLTDFPKRKFILIGDSGESDPEIYADIARDYPERILAIHIRNVTGEDRAAPRYQKTFAGIDPQIWHLRD
jgi:phosphatidate phosphatase APP1